MDPRAEQTANPDSDQAKTDQFWQWEAFDKKGNLGVDYYDRQYGKPTGSPAAPATTSGPATPTSPSRGAGATT